MVHRDIKPGNVLITHDGQVKVTDFGIARAVNTEESLTQTGAVMGTATYFSPEQAEGIGVDARSDIYSLGVVLFEMLTGRPPFLGDTPVSVASKHVRDIPPTPRELLETVPVELEAVVMKAMAKRPDQRYQSAEEFRADLVRYLEGQPVEAGSPNGNLAATGALGAVAPTSVLGRVTGRTKSVPRPPARREQKAGFDRRWWWLGLLGVLLVVLAVVAYLLVSTFTGGFALPDVVGQPLVHAEQTLTAKGLVIGTTTNQANRATTGTVIRTDPSAGTRVSKHAVVNLVVSVGEATVKVPSVVELDLASAEAVLTNDHLNYKVDFVTSNGQQNFVLSQHPLAGTLVRRGNTVVISIPNPTNQVTVPNLVGLSAQQAAAELAPSLSVGSQTQNCSNTYPAGQVSGSSPPAGASISRGQHDQPDHLERAVPGGGAQRGRAVLQRRHHRPPGPGAHGGGGQHGLVLGVRRRERGQPEPAGRYPGQPPVHRHDHRLQHVPAAQLDQHDLTPGAARPQVGGRPDPGHLPSRHPGEEWSWPSCRSSSSRRRTSSPTRRSRRSSWPRPPGSGRPGDPCCWPTGTHLAAT